MPQKALGLPDQSNYGDVSQLTPGQLVDWVVQQHDAQRAGRHFDVRFGTPDTGLHSWAVRRGLPQPGEKHLAIQQPIHEHGYKEFEGIIPQGYGAGTVRRQQGGQVLITKVEPGSIHFTTAQGRFPERYALIKPKAGKNWLLLNTTPTQQVPYGKVHYATIPTEKAEEVIEGLQPGSSVQAKIDGAASLTKLFKDHVEVVSYRTAKGTGYPIVHTERVLHGRPRSQIPPELVGSVIRGELYGVGPEGRSIPPQQLGGILNAGVAKAIQRQRDQQIKLKNMVFDVHQLGSTPVGDMPYDQRMAKLREILPHLPGETFHLPEEARTPAEARAMFEKIRTGQHPLTNEGIVIHPATGKPTKVKFMDDHDVYLREVFPGEGKYKGTAAGGFRYSHEPEGPIVGEVGTGLSDDLRRDLWENQANYIGRVAKVRAQQRFPSGALRAPSLVSMHEDYPAQSIPAPAVGSARQRVLTQRQPLPQQPMSDLNGALASLRQAKMESDRGNYGAKHDLLRQQIRLNPQHFIMDSEEGGIVGLTHKPTGFKIHMPATAIPTELKVSQGAQV